MCVCVCGIQGRVFEPLSRKIAGHSHLLQASEQCFCKTPISPP